MHEKVSVHNFRLGDNALDLRAFYQKLLIPVRKHLEQVFIYSSLTMLLHQETEDGQVEVGMDKLSGA